AAVNDFVRENEGIDEADPLQSMDDGIRLEPFNMRREMKEGHFDESGFYVTNKDEEKKVTDAWLDTVDQAAKAASFKKAAAQKLKAAEANKRITAMAHNLGPDSEGEEEEDKEDKEVLEGEDAEKAATEAKAKEEAEAAATKAEEEAEPAEAENEIAMLEELISFLRPLENPNQALARITKGGADASDAVVVLEPLKMRARVKQLRKVEEATKAAAKTAAAAGAAKQKRRKLNEWGEYADYEQPADRAAEAPPEQPATGTAAAAEPSGGVETVGGSAASAEGEGNGKAAEPTTESTDKAALAATAAAAAEAAAAEAAAAPTNSDKADKAVLAAAAAAAAEAAANAAAVAAAENSSVTNPEAVAKAAEKATADAKAVAEAAKAFAAEMKMSRSSVNFYPEQGPEAAALVNLNSEEVRAVREAAQPKQTLAEDQPFDFDGTVPKPGSKKKELGEVELARRKKIERLTDLCDRLLERGVLVYDSTRELMAIDVRERKGEKFTAPDASESKAGGGDAPTDAAAAAAAAPTKSEAPKPAGEVLYSNKRFKPSAGDASVAVESLDSLLAATAPVVAAVAAASTEGSSSGLFWQFRWTSSSGGNTDELHGPFDSVTMQGWTTQGCFSAERQAEVRQCDQQNNPQERCWHSWEKIDFALYV
ncbi:unnamed protein product, partial [Polarella glacialis]